jgi:ribosomal protein L37AE/L43A
VSTAVEYEVSDLLRRTGAVPPRYGRGKWTCPRCQRTALSVNQSSGLFNCFHAGCDFRGNAFTLARELGLTKRLSSAEARALRLEKEQAERASSAFSAQVRAARFGLAALHIELLNLRGQAQARLKVNSDNEAAWEVLAYIHSQLPRVRAALLLLSEGTIGDRRAWLEADERTHHEMVDRILRVGGVPTFDDKFIEIG